MNITKLLEAESRLIDGMFKHNKIYARVNPAKSFYSDATAGFIRYGLTLRPDQKFDRVESLQRELSVELNHLRAKYAKASDPISVRPVSSPLFALEVPHPSPVALQWSGRTLTTAPPNGLILGQSYGDAMAIERIDLADASGCHVLIAGITGSGKTSLLRHGLLSLTAGTSPQDLKIVLIDLKNQDLIPFQKLPHVATFAGSKDAALAAIQCMIDEKDRRIAQPSYRPFRLVLVVDELAELAGIKDVSNALGSLACVGRGMGINLIGCTQHPTEKGGLGSLLKANFPVRLVGQVAPGQSYAATGRGGTHADLLPGKGSFLRLYGPHVRRFQSFFIDDQDVELMTRRIANHWNAQVLAPKLADSAKPTHSAPTIKRDEIDDIADQVEPLLAQGLSKRKMSMAVLNKEYVGSYAAKIDAAIRRIEQRRGATAEGATTATAGATHTSESDITNSSSSTDGKIIRLALRKVV